MCIEFTTWYFTRCVTASTGVWERLLLVSYITVLLIFQVDMNSPSRVSTVPNLWVPLGERVGWARGIPVTRPSLTTRWIHYFLACCWQYVTIDMYSTVQGSTEVITPVQVVNDKAISKVKKCSVGCLCMETTSCAIPHSCSIIHFNISCSLVATATMPTGRTAQSLTAGSGSKRWLKRESCEHLIPSWFPLLSIISHDPWTNHSCRVFQPTMAPGVIVVHHPAF